MTCNLDTPNNRSYKIWALDILPYFHGANPFAMVHLSNIYRYGAARSAICRLIVLDDDAGSARTVIKARAYSCRLTDLSGRQCRADR